MKTLLIIFLILTMILFILLFIESKIRKKEKITSTLYRLEFQLKACNHKNELLENRIIFLEEILKIKSLHRSKPTKFDVNTLKINHNLSNKQAYNKAYYLLNKKNI
jgi:predicted Holliday junction resolvase-like endonuclease